MFVPLFLQLREAGVPVSLREYLTLLEAMAAATPPIVTRIESGLQGVIDSGVHGMIAEVVAQRKKYDDLVAFTVNLTAERDALATELA